MSGSHKVPVCARVAILSFLSPRAGTGAVSYERDGACVWTGWCRRRGAPRRLKPATQTQTQSWSPLLACGVHPVALPPPDFRPHQLSPPSVIFCCDGPRRWSRLKSQKRSKCPSHPSELRAPSRERGSNTGQTNASSKSKQGRQCERRHKLERRGPSAGRRRARGSTMVDGPPTLAVAR